MITLRSEPSAKLLLTLPQNHEVEYTVRALYELFEGSQKSLD
jgi:hypothetical protein